MNRAWDATKDGLSKLTDIVDSGIKRAEPLVGTALGLAALNGGALWAIAQTSDLHASGASRAVAASALTLVTTAADRLLLRRWNGRRILPTINEGINNRPLAYFRDAVMLGLAYLGVNAAVAPAKDVIHDVRRAVAAPTYVEQTVVVTPPTPSPAVAARDYHQKPEALKGLHYTPIVTWDFSGVQLAPAGSVIGMIQRVERYRREATLVGKRYGIPPDILLAMGMQESGGDPLMENSEHDGGLGLLNIQGTTAQDYGLNTVSQSDKDNDPVLGERIHEMLEKCNYEIPCTSEYDDRTIPLVDLDAAARIMRNAMGDSKDISIGVQAFRGGDRTTQEAYLRAVQKWYQVLKDSTTQARAAEAFRESNGHSLQRYFRRIREMEEMDWGFSPEAYLQGR